MFSSSWETLDSARNPELYQSQGGVTCLKGGVGTCTGGQENGGQAASGQAVSGQAVSGQAVSGLGEGGQEASGQENGGQRFTEQELRNIEKAAEQMNDRED